MILSLFPPPALPSAKRGQLWRTSRLLSRSNHRRQLGVRPIPRSSRARALLPEAIHHQQRVVYTEAEAECGNQVGRKYGYIGEARSQPDEEEATEYSRAAHQQRESRGDNRTKDEQQQNDAQRDGDALRDGDVFGNAIVERVRHSANARVVQVNALEGISRGFLDESRFISPRDRLLVLDEEVGGLTVGALECRRVSEREVAAHFANTRDAVQRVGQLRGGITRGGAVYILREVGDDGEIHRIVAERFPQDLRNLSRLRIRVAVARRLEAAEGLQAPDAGASDEGNKYQQRRKRLGEHKTRESFHSNKLTPKECDDVTVQAPWPVAKIAEAAK